MKSLGGSPPWGLTLLTIGGFLFLHLPLLVIIFYAFSSDEATLRFPPSGLTLHWFAVAGQRVDLWRALWLSLRVASLAVLSALLLGSLAAMGVARRRLVGNEALSLLILLPIALPGIVSGIALRSGLGWLGIPFSLWTLVIGHTTFCLVVVYNNVLARLRRLGSSPIEASLDLGATPWQTWRYIVLPEIATALLAGGLLAFALSFDEIVVTTFTAGQQQTLPIWIFSQLTKPRQRPVLNVAALLVIATTTLPILLAHFLTQESKSSDRNPSQQVPRQ
ncbi:MAG: ABC transporter permease [Cyanobacteriota bacterium]|nr:ABC transporter permease [Cyanobacteriota bacterium]